MAERPLPEATDLEEQILGALILEKDAYIEISDILKPEMFYSDVHAIVYRVITEMIDKDKPVDLMTLYQELKSEGKVEKVGGHQKITELTDKVGSSANIEHHARIVQEKYMRRKLINDGHRISNLAYDESQDVFDLHEKAEKDLIDVGGLVYQGDGKILGDITKTFVDQVESLEQGKIDGVRSGIPCLDEVTHGFHNSDFIVFAARPGMGKTSSLIEFSKQIANTGKVGVFSLEMSATQLYAKYVSNITGIDSSKFRNRGLSTDEWKLFNDGLNNKVFEQIIIDDNPVLTPFALKSKCRRWAKKHDLKAIFIDYLQLMDYQEKGISRDEKISAITRGCKMVAKDLNIPVIAYSQLNRGVEQRGGLKKPTLADLRESGAIEQDTDVVAFKWWPKAYGFNDIEGTPTEGYTYFIVAKNRHGQVKEIPVRFDETTSRLWDDNFTDEQIPF